MTARRLAILCVALVIGGVFIALDGLYRSETFERRYADRAAAVEDGVIARGWIPEFLPESARDLILEGDLDSNNVWLAFSFSPNDRDWVGACSAANIEQIKLLRSAPGAWADWLSPAEAQGADVAFFLCEGGGALALHLAKGEAFYWGR